jgi:DNA-binding transcriptional LysR family regulator
MAIVDMTDRDRTLHFRKLCRRNFYAALPADHPLSHNDVLTPPQLTQQPQIVFNHDMENTFGQWASGFEGEDKILCTVNTANAALDLVAANLGICLLSEDCVAPRENVCFVPVKNWHQALYVCILYDKWLEPPVWNFVEQLIKVLRNMYQQSAL